MNCIELINKKIFVVESYLQLKEMICSQGKFIEVTELYNDFEYIKNTTNKIDITSSRLITVNKSKIILIR
jgi:hypothetical protein